MELCTEKCTLTRMKNLKNNCPNDAVEGPAAKSICVVYQRYEVDATFKGSIVGMIRTAQSEMQARQCCRRLRSRR